MSLWQAIILAIVEGITEFLPISSTGHMVIVASYMGIAAQPFTKVFMVCIQLGAIMSVVVIYFQRFFKSLDFYFKLLAAFIPTAILGLLLKKHIDAMLENVTVVAVTLLLGGIVLLFVDNWFAKNEEAPENEISYKKAVVIGTFQAMSMIPGMSRSAVSIIGGLTQKLNRQAAAEFSFFLAVPTMFGATVKSLYDEKEMFLQPDFDWSLLIVGNIVAFIVAMLAIKFFIGILTKYGFKAFGYYRIILGLIILGLMFSGQNLQIAD